MSHYDLIARPIVAIDDAELLAERLRARIAAGDRAGAARALAALESKTRAAAAILRSRRMLLEHA